MEHNNIKTGCLKACAMGALKHCIEHLLMQYEIKYKVQIKGIEVTKNGVILNWAETEQGVRSDDEVKKMYDDMLMNQLGLLTNKLVGNKY